jgi:hypothetical protein
MERSLFLGMCWMAIGEEHWWVSLANTLPFVELELLLDKEALG